MIDRNCKVELFTLQLQPCPTTFFPSPHHTCELSFLGAHRSPPYPHPPVVYLMLFSPINIDLSISLTRILKGKRDIKHNIGNYPEETYQLEGEKTPFAS